MNFDNYTGGEGAERAHKPISAPASAGPWQSSGGARGKGKKKGVFRKMESAEASQVVWS